MVSRRAWWGRSPSRGYEFVNYFWSFHRIRLCCAPPSCTPMHGRCILCLVAAYSVAMPVGESADHRGPLLPPNECQVPFVSRHSREPLSKRRPCCVSLPWSQRCSRLIWRWPIIGRISPRHMSCGSIGRLQVQLHLQLSPSIDHHARS